VRVSHRSAIAVIGACGVFAQLNVAAGAHRLDEYLQAARVSLSTDGLVVELDLTPGAIVAPSVLAAIDTDRDAQLSLSEQRAYADRVLQDFQVAIDGLALHTAVIRAAYPPVEALTEGEGTIRLEVRATFEQTHAGRHRLILRNDHRPDIGVYLANALVPMTSAIAIKGQYRDGDQRELLVEYDALSHSVAPLTILVPAIIALLGTLGYVKHRRP
jgi:hypothetical protein